MTFKLIFKGELYFGNKRTYDMAYSHYLNRIETCFRTDVLFEAEESFNEETFSFHIPRMTSYETERRWRATSSLLNELAQYAIASGIQAWCLMDGRLIENPTFEPDTDKTAVQAFRIGRSLTNEEGREDEATQALTKAIEKFQRHAQAYAWRGYIKLKLKDFKAAGEDFSRSIDINPTNPDPFYGRAKVCMIHNDWEGAVQDLDAAINTSIPWQTVYYRARIKKGECLFHLKRFDEALREFSLYLKRRFVNGDPHIYRRRRAFHYQGKAFLELNRYDEAMVAFDKAHEIQEGIERLPDSENLYSRGLAKQRAGKQGFISDFKEAAEKGSKEAAAMLSTLS